MNLESVFHLFPIAITVTDKEGKIIYMNQASGDVNAGGDAKALLQRQVRDFHKKARSQEIIERLFQGEKNVYTIQKKGERKLIYQAPWYEGESVGGLVELSLVLPEHMPHYNRDAGE